MHVLAILETVLPSMITITLTSRQRPQAGNRILQRFQYPTMQVQERLLTPTPAPDERAEDHSSRGSVLVSCWQLPCTHSTRLY